MINIEEFANTSELFDGHYALIRPLSVDGATADVWLALDMNTVTEDIRPDDVARLHDDEIEKLGLMVAIKIYRPQNALDIEGEQRFRDEYMIVYNCNHTNLIHPNHFSIFKGIPDLDLRNYLLVINLKIAHYGATFMTCHLDWHTCMQRPRQLSIKTSNLQTSY